MNNNGHGYTGTSFYQSTNSSTSTLRPRNNRLISYEDGSPQTEAVVSTSSACSTPPRLNSESASPSLAGDSRARTKAKSQTAHLHENHDHVRATSVNTDRRASGILWDSLSNIQGFASTILGSETSNAPVKRSSSMKKPGPGRMVFDKSSGAKQAPQEWGPASQRESKPASIEEQRALLQAKRREILLSQSVEQQKDQLGRYKRKDSNAGLRPGLDHLDAGDVLVYRHTVSPNDTMAGVVIRYNCQPEAFRKANRFWPNDNIQRRKYVILPVDACSIKGRKTDGPYIADIANQDMESEGGRTRSQNLDASNRPSLAEPFPAAVPENEEYKHDCWVLLPSFAQPVEILRISKRALGYFPPARRKSITSSQFSDSATSTPKTSFDMLRHPPTHAAQQAAAQLQQQQVSLSLNNSPIRQQSLPRHLTATSRTRSSSTVSASNGHSQNTFLSSLQGPGGVGNLRGLRSERARAGPGEDPLNKKLAQYIPDLLPPDHHAVSSLGSSLRPPHGRATSNSLRATPRASIDSIRSTRSNSSSVPAAIAGWVGKVGTSPMRRNMEGNLASSRNNSTDFLGQVMGSTGDLGDLIELDATPDEVSKQLHEDITPTAIPTAESSGNPDKDDLLNERFPIRGRVRRAYEAD